MFHIPTLCRFYDFDFSRNKKKSEGRYFSLQIANLFVLKRSAITCGTFCNMTVLHVPVDLDLCCSNNGRPSDRKWFRGSTFSGFNFFYQKKKINLRDSRPMKRLQNLMSIGNLNVTVRGTSFTKVSNLQVSQFSRSSDNKLLHACFNRNETWGVF